MDKDRDPPTNFHDFIARFWEPYGHQLSQFFAPKQPAPDTAGVSVPITSTAPAEARVRVRVRDDYSCYEAPPRARASTTPSTGTSRGGP